MSGPLRSLRSSRSTSSSRALSASTSPARDRRGVGGASRRRRGRGGRAGVAVRLDATARSERGEAGAVVDEDADVALGLGAGAAPRRAHRRAGRRRRRRVGRRPAATRISIALPARRPSSAATSRRSQQAGSRRRAAARSCSAAWRARSDAGERDVLELADVAERRRPAARPRSAAHRVRGVDVAREPAAAVPARAATGRTAGRSRCRRRGCGLVEQRERAVEVAVRPDAAGPSATRQRYGYCGSPACSPSSALAARWRAAASRSLRSSRTSVRPTCMSAVPRSPGCSATSIAGPDSKRAASRRSSRPWATWMSADRRSSTPRMSAMWPAATGWRSTRRSGDRAASRSPARPGREPEQRGGAAAPEVVGRFGRARAHGRRARSVPSMSPAISASAARYISIWAGSRANSSWSNDDRRRASRGFQPSPRRSSSSGSTSAGSPVDHPRADEVDA